jgi:putative ABC transport system permease protein
MVFFTNFYENYTSQSLLHDKTSEIAVTDPGMRMEYDADGKLNTIKKVQTDYGVCVSMYNYSTPTLLKIYTTDYTLGGRISLNKGTFPDTGNYKQYISNKVTDDTNNVGFFETFGVNPEIRIYSVDAFNSYPYFFSTYYLNTTDAGTVQKISDDLYKTVGNTKIEEVGVNADLTEILKSDIYTNFALLCFATVTVAVLVFALIRYAVAECRSVSIRRINGMSFCHSLLFDLRNMLKIYGVSFAVTGVASALYFGILYSPSYIYLAVAVAFVISVLALVCSLLVVIIVQQVQFAFYRNVDIINGQKPLGFLTVFQFALKYITLLMILTSLQSSFSVQHDLNLQLNSESAWKNAENVYSFINDTPYLHPAENRPFEEGCYNLYREMEKNLNLFMIDCQDYRPEDSNQGPFSPWYNSIWVNQNYLKRENIRYDASKLIFDRNTLNILMPEKYRGNEAEIVPLYKEIWKFKLQDAPNIYNDAMGKPKITVPNEQVHVNVIYIENGQSYFTYNNRIRPEDNNKITDVIAMVDTGYNDYSDYFSAMAGSCFIESNSNDPVSDIEPFTKELGLQSNYHRLQSVFNERANVITGLKSQLLMFTIGSVLLTVILIFTIFLFAACYCERYRKNIYIKRLYGFDYLRINFKLIALTLVADIACVIGYGIAIPLKIGLVLFDVVVTFLLTVAVSNGAVKDMLKRE